MSRLSLRLTILTCGLLFFVSICHPQAKLREVKPSGDVARARVMLEHDRVDAAANLLASLLAREPANAGAWTLMGIVHAKQGDAVQAEASFRKAIAIDPRETAAEMNLGHLLLDHQRQSEALPYLRDALQHEHANAPLQQMFIDAAEGTAVQQRAAGDRNAALGTLLAAKAEAPRNFALLVDLSILEDELRLLHDADRDVQQARALRPTDPKALYAEARVKMDLQNMPAAADAMRAYLKQRPDDATAHYGLGRILQISQQPDAAKAEFARSIELAPNQAESYYQIGQIALDQGKYDEAERESRKALDRDPKHGGALAALGIAAFRLKRYPDAVQSLRAAIVAAPEYQPAHYYYGLALARIGDAAASERELKVAAEMANAQNKRDAQRMELSPAGKP